jgi:hypothetical protein
MEKFQLSRSQLRRIIELFDPETPADEDILLELDNIQGEAKDRDVMIVVSKSD